jgi:ribosomal protein S18 acetylase RimI-like enzyme
VLDSLTRTKHKGIRPLQPARDLDQLADLIENAFGRELAQGGQAVLRELRLLARMGPLSLLFTEMTSEVDGIFTGYVWEEGGRVVGNVTVSRPTGHPLRWQISNVAVLDTYRRRGIGRALVEAALDLIVARGGRTAYLFVRDDNPAALRLYEALGFVQVDRTTDLETGSRPAAVPTSLLSVLRPLRFDEGEALYDLAAKAIGPGQRWLSPLRRRQYVLSGVDRLSQWIQGLFSGERETRWGLWSGGRLQAGMLLRATRLWNSKPHCLRLWVHPSWRGLIEETVACDVAALLAGLAPRPTRISLPGCEERAVAALMDVGFWKVRTLILMKLEL